MYRKLYKKKKGKVDTLNGHFNGLYARLTISHQLDEVNTFSGWKVKPNKNFKNISVSWTTIFWMGVGVEPIVKPQSELYAR
jgi:hypothetical protein